LAGADGAAWGIHGLEDEDAEAGAGEENGGGKAIGAGANDDCIMGGGSHELEGPLRIHGGYCSGERSPWKDSLRQSERAKSGGDPAKSNNDGRHPHPFVKKRLLAHGFCDYFHWV